MTHTIYASHLDSVQRKLARLAKKAERYSVPFSFSIGEEHPVEIAIREYDYVTQTVYTAQTILTRCKIA